MTNSRVLLHRKSAKNHFYDETRQTGMSVENLLSGSVRTSGADGIVIAWSESPRGRKHIFDSSSVPLSAVDEKGFSVRSADGLFDVRTDFSAGGDGTLVKRVGIRASRDVFLHSVTVDSLPAGRRLGARGSPSPPSSHPRRSGEARGSPSTPAISSWGWKVPSATTASRKAECAASITRQDRFPRLRRVASTPRRPPSWARGRAPRPAP